MEFPPPTSSSGRRDPSGHPRLPDLRSLYEWVDTIPLSRPRRNLARDFSDAVLAAEAVAFLFPEEAARSMGRAGPSGAYQPANSLSGKIYNWCCLRERVLRRLGVPATRGDVEAAARGEPGAAEWVLAMLRQRAERESGGSGGGRGAARPPPPVAASGFEGCRSGWRAAAIEATAAASRRRSDVATLSGRGGEKNAGAGDGGAARRRRQRRDEHKEQLAPVPPTASPQKQRRERQSASQLEAENDELRRRVARLERLALRQEAQVEALLLALEEASRVRRASEEAEAEAEEARGRASGRETEAREGDVGDGGLAPTACPPPAPPSLPSPLLRALEGAVLVGRC